MHSLSGKNETSNLFLSPYWQSAAYFLHSHHVPHAYISRVLQIVVQAIINKFTRLNTDRGVVIKPSPQSNYINKCCTSSLKYTQNGRDGSTIVDIYNAGKHQSIVASG